MYPGPGFYPYKRPGPLASNWDPACIRDPASNRSFTVILKTLRMMRSQLFTLLIVIIKTGIAQMYHDCTTALVFGHP